jgi:hypothetical protein
VISAGGVTIEGLLTGISGVGSAAETMYARESDAKMATMMKIIFIIALSLFEI